MRSEMVSLRKDNYELNHDINQGLVYEKDKEVNH